METSRDERWKNFGRREADTISSFVQLPALLKINHEIGRYAGASSVTPS